mmetsp:Transcript_15374/g.31474  ORF Transcript_15374/g.31474 Transcript_15374/m.31474 type:complete len:1068 (-) Transcript_15374:127-3330(-)
MFEKTLSDLVSGIRSSRRNTALYISQNIAEIKTELQSPDFFVKSNALQKLTFLQMMGYTMSWAAFSAVEVMSSPRFAHKRIGYLAACQGLDPDNSPVVLLTTNLLKKELRGATVGGSGEGMYNAGLAINCLSNIVTEDLGRELLPDLLHLLNHPNPYIRKKVLLCLYKVFLKYPQGLRLSFDRIKACLDDSHPSVVSCAVNVITELSDVNPKNYLPLAPAFFKLLTSSANNWMLIKVVKLLGSLVPEEPRLARKLLEPLSNIVKATHAKSLLYEAVYATTLCLQYVKKSDGSQPANIPQVVELCASTLRNFVQDSDQNLKYLGLVGFGSLLKSQPKVLMSHSEHRGLILKCLSDEDVTIRTRALGLLKFMATERNLVELINQLLGHVEAASGQYRCDLVATMIGMCSSNKYELIVDFSWYVDVLVTLSGVRGIEGQGEVIAKQWMDVAWRVLPVRPYAVRRSLEILVCRGQGVSETSENEVGESLGHSEGERYILSEVLPAAAWIVGEYSHLLPEALAEEGMDNIDSQYDSSSKGIYHSLIQSLTAPTDAAGINPLPCDTQAVFVQNAMKVFSAACHHSYQTDGTQGMDANELSCSDAELNACVVTLLKNLVIYMESPDVEVKERAFTSYQLLQCIGLETTNNGSSSVQNYASNCKAASSTLKYLLTPEPMKPISAKAQRRKLAEAPPSPISVQEWDNEIQWNAFWFLDEETACFGKNGVPKGTIESFSFTKQQSTVETSVTDGKHKDQFLDITDRQGGTEATSFGNDTGCHFSSTNFTNAPAASNRRDGDPFYLHPSTPRGSLLDSAPVDKRGSLPQTDKDAAEATSTRFGSIQLDSGGESQDESDKKPKKKKKHKAKKLSRVQAVTSAKIPWKQDLIISDDDDEEEVDAAHKKPRGNSSKKGRPFENLALVDLTTPLGEEDIMPRNEHYVVPDRPRTKPEIENSMKSKKKKKEKHKKMKSSRKEEKSGGAITGDLLGFDMMPFESGDNGGAAPAKTDVGSARKSTTSNSHLSNPVNSAFDDLLGLEMDPIVSSVDYNEKNEGNQDSNEGVTKRKKAKKEKKKKKT